MEAIIDQRTGIIIIDGEIWHTRESFMSHFGLKKSTFYNLKHTGQIKSLRLFSDKRTKYFVYQMGGTAND